MGRSGRERLNRELTFPYAQLLVTNNRAAKAWGDVRCRGPLGEKKGDICHIFKNKL